MNLKKKNRNQGNIMQHTNKDRSRIIGSKDKNIFVAKGINIHKKTNIVPDSFFKPHKETDQVLINNKQKELEKKLMNVIGKPFFSDQGFILYKGDCLDLMSRIVKLNIAVNLTVTSPPYNIGKEYENSRSIENFTEWCIEWMNLIYLITEKNGTFFLNLGYFEVPNKGYCVPIPYLLWDKTKFYLMQEIVWRYGAGVSSKRRLSPRNEKWLWYVKNSQEYTFNLDSIRDPNVKYPNQKKNGKFRCNPLGKNPSDVWEFPKVTSGFKRSSKERTMHPAQFPLKVVERIILGYSNCKDIILDPFSGSGSTGIAAYGTGRIYLGIELRSDYCEMSIERYKNFKRTKQEINAQLSFI